MIIVFNFKHKKSFLRVPTVKLSRPSPFRVAFAKALSPKGAETEQL